MDAAKHAPAPVIYPESDDMGEHETHFQIAVLLVPLLTAFLTLRRRLARVAGNQFWYFVKGDPTQCRAPDLYVVDGVTPTEPDRATWSTWEGHRPAFVLEIVSAKWQKDYDEAPTAYGAMRAKEVIVFDPWATPRSRRRVRWQVFRRLKGRGLVRVFAGQGDRVESRELGCWFRLVDQGTRPRLRLATGPHGDDLVPTDAERAEAAAAQALSATARAEAEQAAKEAAIVQATGATTRAEAAEAELARLREEIARLPRH